MQPSSQSTPASEDAASFHYVHSKSFVDLLASLNASLFVSTYQAGKLMVFRTCQDRLSMLPRTFDQAMGLAVDARRLAVATKWQVWTLYNTPQLAPGEPHDACYVPNTAHVTGNLDTHEIAWCGQELWLVNTAYSCLCTLEPPYSFVPRWRPPFISLLANQDRCHLNGVAIAAGRPRAVTVFAKSDVPEGWRQHKKDGGCLIDVLSGETMAAGLSMPHSPRIHDGRCWLLDSGRGRLVLVDAQTGKLETIAELPGYTRGLALHQRLAFVGLSKVRDAATFGDIPIVERHAERKCGVHVIDTVSGATLAFLEFQGDITEIFDVQLLLGIRYPAVVGFRQDTIQHTCVMGPERAL